MHGLSSPLSSVRTTILLCDEQISIDLYGILVPQSYAWKQALIPLCDEQISIDLYGILVPQLYAVVYRVVLAEQDPAEQDFFQPIRDLQTRSKGHVIKRLTNQKPRNNFVT